MSVVSLGAVPGEPLRPRVRHTHMDSIRTRRRALIAAGTTAALLGVFAAGVQIGATDAQTMPGTVGPRVTAPDPFRLASAALSPVTSCDVLLDSYRERALGLVGPWGWEGDMRVMPLAAAAAELGTRDSAAPAPASRARTSEAVSSETGTNVQEAGVDEPDTVKTDGETLYRLRDARLTVHDVSGDAPEELSSISVPQLRDGELLLVEDRLVAVGEVTGRRPGTRVVTLDVSDPAAPKVTDEWSVSAALVTARLHDGVVRVVTDNGLPELDFVHPSGRRGERSARLRNERLVNQTTLGDWLPQVDDTPAVDCSAVAVPQDPDAALGTVTTIAFTPGDEAARSAVAVATSTDIAYFSSDRLHLATAPRWSFLDWRSDIFGPRIPDTGSGTTSLYSFELDGAETTFTAAGEVDGQIADRWSMDSADEVLRVAVGPTEATGNFNSVVTLIEEDGALVERGRVDKLGVGEEIKSVRWFDDLALVVTFRQTDPLYAVDLTDAATPALLGELKIPGFSQYLHPLGGRRMIGIGQDATLTGRTIGAQAALFDVHDLTDLEQMHVHTYPRGTQAGAAEDPRQFTWLPQQRTALTVVSKGWRGRTGWVSALRVEGGKLHETRTEVEYGTDIDLVRLVPLPGEKVVLVTGDEVSFFDVD